MFQEQVCGVHWSETVAGSGDRQQQMVVDGVPYRAPGGRPDRSVACLDLVDSIVAQILFDLHDGGPKNGPRSTGVSSPERTIMVVLSLQNICKKRAFVISNVVSSMNEKASVDGIEIPDTQPTIFLRLTNILPGSKSNRRGRIVSPPKSSDDGIDIFDKSLGKRTMDM